MSSTASKSHPPVFFIILGLCFLFLWFLGFMAQIQTNEAFVRNAGQVNIFQPDWSILLQIPNYLFGNLSSGEGVAALVGWGIELFYLGLIVAGFEVMTHAVSRSGVVMGKIFITLSILLIVFNSYTDYMYGSVGIGPWGHALFAAIMFFVVGFAGAIGLFFIEHGWKHA